MEEEIRTPEENVNREEAAESENETDGLTAKIEELQKTATEKDLKINELEKRISDLSKKHKETESRLADAVNSYRTMITVNNAEIPAELITGDSIEEIDGSLVQAKILVNRIKQGLESEIAATRIPGGAPVRGDLDISGLSPIEKIKYAMGRKQ